LSLALLLSIKTVAQHTDGHTSVLQVSASKESPNVAYIRGNVNINYYLNCPAQGLPVGSDYLPYRTASASLSISDATTYLTQPATTTFGVIPPDVPNLLGADQASDAMSAYLVSPPPAISWDQHLIRFEGNANNGTGSGDLLNSLIPDPSSTNLLGETNSPSLFTTSSTNNDTQAQMPQWLLNAYPNSSNTIAPPQFGLTVATSLNSVLYAGPQGITLTADGGPPVSIYDAFSQQAAPQTFDLEGLRKVDVLHGEQNYTQGELSFTYDSGSAQKIEFGLGSSSLNDELTNLQNSGKKVVSWSVVYEEDTTPTVPAAQ
jgi:hypothetical protein